MATLNLNDVLGGINYGQIVSMLFNARTNAHIAHLKTNSYAQHIALNEFYTQIVDLADRFTESVQSDEIIQNYEIGQLQSDIVSLLKSNQVTLLGFKAKLNPQKQGHLIQILDDCVELYTTTLYKLTKLK